MKTTLTYTISDFYNFEQIYDISTMTFVGIQILEPCTIEGFGTFFIPQEWA